MIVQKQMISVVLVSGLTGLLALGFLGCGDKGPKERDVVRPAKTIVVGGDSNVTRRRFAGVVRAKEEAALAFRVSGLLKEFNVVAGQEFKAGDVLAQLDARDYKAQLDLAASSLMGQQAQMNLLKAGAREEDISKMQAGVASAKSAFSTAKAQFERYEKLFEKGDIGKADYDAQKQARDAAQANLAQAEKSLEIGKKGARKEDLTIQSANIGGASAQMQSAKDAMEYTTLKAPFDGVIGQTFVNSFEEIQAKQQVLTFQDLTMLKIDVDVPEDVMLTFNQYKREKLVAVFEALPGQEFPLTREEVNMEADPVTRTYKITLGMTPPDNTRILPGMSATVILDLKSKVAKSTTTFGVPVTAVIAVEKEAPYVWVADAKTLKVKKTKVKIGPISGDSIQVIEGLKAGQIVVTSGASYLKEGQQIKKLNPKKADAQAGGQ